MASDRLRDLFLAAYFRSTFEEYKKANEKRKDGPRNLKPGYYQYPFAAASNAPRVSGLATNLVELLSLAGKIYLSRESRNATVHDLATKAAKYMKEFLATDSPGLMTRNAIPHKEILESAQKVHEANCAELDDAIDFVTRWYRNIVKAASIAFAVEHELTRNPATP